MIDYQQSIDYQIDQFKEKIAAPLLESLQSLPTKKVEKTYKYIFLLNHLKSRPELKKFWNEYLNWSISFLYESFVSASLGQKHGCYFLLRSSLENFVKFIYVLGKKTRSFKNAMNCLFILRKYLTYPFVSAIIKSSSEMVMLKDIVNS